MRSARPPTWGWYRLDAHLEEGGDTERVLARHDRRPDAAQPVYFVTGSLDGNRDKVPEVVQADLTSLAVVDKAGKVVGGYNLKP